ncbi:Methyltransferase type 12 [Acidisarcina polymorpha]|uniref:Methyltransferase type 12 n=1 Tax=Acidisarcina polymorpha TaxID=2211140 RepID=A0A2Z5FVU5_9BACT|nr:class I SAM-dependent methyltransferase [Acidisarcina polymorpha]AXC11013.1 Methyltransferase type 12 [Acidisarcina polymorpha]
MADSSRGGTRGVEPRDSNAIRHPEMAAGGYASNNGTVEFYQRVVAVLPQDGVVLDLGAGRGSDFEGDHGAWHHWLIQLGKRHSCRIGADIDPIVQTHAYLDQAVVIEAGQPLPFPDQSFDLVLCDWVLEHVDDPNQFVAEIRRVLKVGGWFCARTPNRWSYFSVGARLLKSRLGNRLLRLLQAHRPETDKFPKYYRLNTLGAIHQYLPATLWTNATYTHNPDPGYAGNSSAFYHLIELYQRLIPKTLGTVILIFARRLG